MNYGNQEALMPLRVTAALRIPPLEHNRLKLISLHDPVTTLFIPSRQLVSQ